MKIWSITAPLVFLLCVTPFLTPICKSLCNCRNNVVPIYSLGNKLSDVLGSYQWTDPKSSPEASTVPRIRFPSPSCSSWVLLSAGCLWCQNAHAPHYEILGVFPYPILRSAVLFEKWHHALPWLIRYRNRFLSEMTVVVLKQREKISFILKNSNGSNPIQWIFNFKTKP